MASTCFGLRPPSGSSQLSLDRVILILRHSAKLLFGGVAACPSVTCVTCFGQLFYPSSGALDCVTACGIMHPRCCRPRGCKLTLLQGSSQRLHPAFYSKGTASFRLCQAVKLTLHLLLVSTLRTHAAINPFPQYLFILRYVIK